MDAKKALAKILTESSDIALATCTGTTPNVRFMNCCYDEAHPSSVFVLTDADSPKTEEFKENPHVALMSYPGDPSKGMDFVRSNDAVIEKSSVPLEELWDSMVAQIYMFEKVAKMKGDKMALYEIKLKSAQVAYNRETATIEF